MGMNSSAPTLANVPMKRIWLVLMEGVAYVYPHFGGPLKLIISLEWFTPGSSLKDKNIIFMLHHQSYPEFRFSAVGTEDLLRWKCAYICSMRYKQFRDKFEMKQLIEEIVKMDAMHARRYPHRNLSIATAVTTGNGLTLANRTPFAMVPAIHLNAAAAAAAVAAGNDSTISDALISKVKGLALKVKEELHKTEEDDEFEINYSYKNKPVIATSAGLSSSSSEPKVCVANAALRAQILRKKNLEEVEQQLRLPPVQKHMASDSSDSPAAPSTAHTSTSSHSNHNTSSSNILDVIRDVALQKHTKDQLQEEIQEEYEVDDTIINENVAMIGMRLTEQMLLKGAKKKLKRKKRPKKRLSMIRKSILAPPPL